MTVSLMTKAQRSCLFPCWDAQGVSDKVQSSNLCFDAKVLPEMLGDWIFSYLSRSFWLLEDRGTTTAPTTESPCNCQGHH